MLTVTYGTACAPFLAIRVLLQLAQDEGVFFPEAADVLRHATYVDDVLFGADDITSARNLRAQLIELMRRGGFHLRKWAANDAELLRDVSLGDHELALDHALDDTDVLRVLRLIWLPAEDAFRFQVSELKQTTYTKRSILSIIARLFDPLGWAAPVIISAKLLMQDLWLQKIDWDDPIPNSLLSKWENYYRDLPKLATARIPRWTGVLRNRSAIELHGFLDASQRAYSAVVYLRILHSPSDISVTLLAAKSKVAPLKTVTIPRLELNGIVLLVRLLEYVKLNLKYNIVSSHGWTDSTVALAWISQHPSRWKLYVANRVSEVQTKMPDLKWHHIASRFNPADCVSRGTPVEFLTHSLWWSEPPWLQKPSAYWPNTRHDDDLTPTSFKEAVCYEDRDAPVVHASPVPAIWDLSTRFSSWGKLLRFTAYLRRFVRNLRARVNNCKNPKYVLSAAEVKDARDLWLKLVQRSQFAAEIRAIRLFLVPVRFER